MAKTGSHGIVCPSGLSSQGTQKNQLIKENVKLISVRVGWEFVSIYYGSIYVTICLLDSYPRKCKVNKCMGWGGSLSVHSVVPFM